MVGQAGAMPLLLLDCQRFFCPKLQLVSLAQQREKTNTTRELGDPIWFAWIGGGGSNFLRDFFASDKVSI